MKKIIGLSFILAATSMTFAQGNDQVQNKNGVDIMPVQGEFAIGMNALPVLNYVGDLFGYTGSNGSMGSNKFVNYFGANTLFGKYMLTDNTAIRGHFRIGHSSNKYENEVFNDVENDPDLLVMDTYEQGNTSYNIGVGYEWRRGKTRLRGIYGGEVMYQHRTGVCRDFTYGNAFGNGNASPISTEWASWGGVLNEDPAAERMVSSKSGKFNGIGVRAFAGVEYYVAPKMCIGTEFGWGVMGGWNGASSSVTERWDPTAGGSGAVITDEITGGKSTSWNLDTDNFGGALYFMFYF
ncbi:hypothetical protein [Crocinitomix algicola]|uniref:hypothetical protein n=1 Tax=Crocinitomix algicola TaxID=1740263 RepID=UPI0008336E0F|nr:hypothetical protein [Crocinitomix algicola]